MKRIMWALALSTGLAATIPAFAESDSAVVEASRAESGLLIYSTGDARAMETTIAGFNALYPWISVEMLELGGNELWERYRAEAASGVRTADVALGGSPHRFVEAYDRGEVMDYTPVDVDVLPTFPDMVPGVWTVAVDPQVIIFNKALLPEELWPTGFVDLAEKIAANPDVFNGRVAVFDPVASSVGPGYLLGIRSVLGEDAFWTAFEQMAPALRFESGGTAMLEKVTSGEHLVAFLVGRYLSVTRITGAREQIVGWTYHDDGQPLQLRSMAITAQPTSPNSAMLFADFLVSVEGQVAFGGSGSSPVHPDVEDSEGVLTYGTVLEETGGTDNAAYYGYGRDIFEYEATVAPRINELLGR
jgi:iron(III) transport system substrate-binding protein